MPDSWIESLDKQFNQENSRKILSKENYNFIIKSEFRKGKMDTCAFYGPDFSYKFNGKQEYKFIKTPPKELELVNIDCKIDSLENIIEIVKDNPYQSNKKYNIPLKKLHDICPHLEKLNNMVGINKLKTQLLEQIIYFIQDLHINSANESEYLHTILAGPPGTGKTAIAEIIGTIYAHLGILKKKTFKKVTRSDLIGGYLGQTAIKTKDAIKSSLGGVLFIDEAYALGNSEKRDSFSKECIDTLCESLSHYKDQLMVIIAGYEEELQNCFFAYNQGLASRFIWKFKIEKYTAEELSGIFAKKIKDAEWSLECSEIGNKKWFEKNILWFPCFGRDIENLITKIKICHSKRIFGVNTCKVKHISALDLEKGFAIYKENDNLKKNLEKDEMSKSLCSIYV